LLTTLCTLAYDEFIKKAGEIMSETTISLPVDAIRTYCRTQPIQRLAVFGSVLRDDFTPTSDVDLLVEFKPQAKITYFDLFDIQQALTALIGRKEIGRAHV